MLWRRLRYRGRESQIFEAFFTDCCTASAPGAENEAGKAVGGGKERPSEASKSTRAYRRGHGEGAIGLEGKARVEKACLRASRVGVAASTAWQ